MEFISGTLIAKGICGIIIISCCSLEVIDFRIVSFNRSLHMVQLSVHGNKMIDTNKRGHPLWHFSVAHVRLHLRSNFNSYPKALIVYFLDFLGAQFMFGSWNNIICFHCCISSLFQHILEGFDKDRW